MISKSTVTIVAIGSFLILSTIGFAQVNIESLQVFPKIRIAAISIFITSMALLFYNKCDWYIVLFTAAIFLLMYPLTVLRSHQVFLSELGYEKLLISLCVILGSSIILTYEKQRKSETTISTFFVFFSIFVFLFLIVTGGITLIPRISYHFDLASTSGSDVLYDQGITKFFGLSAISTFWNFQHSNSRIFKSISLALTFSFILLSFVGGGRGDFLAAIIVIVLIKWKGGFREFIYLVIFLGVLILFFASFINNYLADSIAVSRFVATIQEGNLGTRGILYSQGLILLIDNVKCLVFGCGFGYFQQYYNYPLGLYPHNVVMEGIITWGMLFMLPLIAVSIIGIAKARRDLGMLFWAGTFFLIIGLKSGDVIGSWFAMAFVICLASSGIQRLVPIKRDAVTARRRWS